jgi:nickel/cobalt transporter (NicO) family protein
MDIASLLKSGAGNPWLLLPAAVGLGAIHALEPGHAKSMIAAFIVAVRGTIWQALVLTIAATVGHTIVVWGVAIFARTIGRDSVTATAEAWLMLLSGVLVAGMALRLLWPSLQHALGRGHPHDHTGHSHGPDDHHHHHDGDTIFGHRHDTPTEITAKFGSRAVSTREVAWFGFTGGLLPCSVAIAVLLASLQMDSPALGFAMVLAFSTGLGLTLAAIGIFAVWGAAQAQANWPRLDRWADRLQVVSMMIVLLMGLFMIGSAITSLRGMP